MDYEKVKCFFYRSTALTMKIGWFHYFSIHNNGLGISFSKNPPFSPPTVSPGKKQRCHVELKVDQCSGAAKHIHRYPPKPKTTWPSFMSFHRTPRTSSSRSRRCRSVSTYSPLPPINFSETTQPPTNVKNSSESILQ